MAGGSGGSSILGIQAAQKARNLKTGAALGITPPPTSALPGREQAGGGATAPRTIDPGAPLQAASPEPTDPDERMTLALDTFYKKLGSL